MAKKKDGKKVMDPILPILSVVRYWAIILGSFGDTGASIEFGGSFNGFQVPLLDWCKGF